MIIMALLGLAVAFGAARADAADTARGDRLYQQHCKNCHGDTGNPVLPGAPNFQRGERLLQADMTLMASIRRGRNAMPAFVGILRDQEIMDVVAYLRTLQR